MQTNAQSPRTIDARLREVFAHFPQVVLVVLFGSVASGQQRADSDLGIALTTGRALTLDEKIALIGALAESTGRAIDLVDLNGAPEPLLGQIVRHGRRVLGSDTLYGELISKHLFEQANFRSPLIRKANYHSPLTRGAGGVELPPIKAPNLTTKFAQQSGAAATRPSALPTGAPFRCAIPAQPNLATFRRPRANSHLGQTCNFERFPIGFNDSLTLEEQAALRSTNL